ncbi:large ribosomal subunit protein uL29m [Mantella aurantiaca]
MAAPAVRVLMAGCRRLCPGGLVGRTVIGLSGVLPSVLSRTPEIGSHQQCSPFHSSSARRGLEEFFDDPQNWGEKTVKAGDLWTIDQLRGKSSEDLHKLWYVLLKEKNMLLTLEQESKRQVVAMPSSDRLYKVTRSMENLDKVVTERETALRLLQTGQQKGRPGEWRKDCFGETTWHRFKEWPIPWYMHSNHMRSKYYALPYVDHYDRLKLEKQLRADSRKRNLAKQKQRDLEKRFPHIAKKS